MFGKDFTANSPIDLERLLPLAVTEALRKENPGTFFAWMRKNAAQPGTAADDQASQPTRPVLKLNPNDNHGLH
jgi:N-acetyl-anhydromuramyl-L-alanine amidase AmpD